MSSVKVLLADDHGVVRRGLHYLLERSPEFTVVGEAADGREAIELARDLQPQVVLMDLRMPGTDGLTAIKHLRQQWPDINVVILTSYDLPEYREAATQSKADYFMAKDSRTNDFLALVESICPCQKEDLNRQKELS